VFTPTPDPSPEGGEFAGCRRHQVGAGGPSKGGKTLPRRGRARKLTPQHVDAG